MKTRFSLLLLAAALVAGWLMWRGGQPAKEPKAVAGNDAKSAVKPAKPRRGGRATVAAVSEALTGAALPTRKEALETIRTLYRKEQFAREHDLNQRRYGGYYWESECNGVELARIEQERTELVRQLKAEANAVLHDLFPGERGDEIELTAFYGAEGPATNLAGLSPATRSLLEERWLVAPHEPWEHLVSAEELAIFRQWNGETSQFLRAQTLGFRPTQAEFDGMAVEVGKVIGPGREPKATPDEMYAGFARVLGAERWAEFSRIDEKTMSTALRDLHRHGLPLDQAGWLAATRTEAIQAIQQVWQDGALTTLAKEQKAAAVQRDYSQTIAAKLGLLVSSLDELKPAP